MLKKTIIAVIFLLPSIALGYSTKEHAVVCAFADIRLAQIQNNFSHQLFYSPDTFAQASKRSTTTLARGFWRENLARNFKNKEDVFKAWENSPSHKANLIATSDYSCLRSANGHYVLITYLHIK